MVDSGFDEVGGYFALICDVFRQFFQIVHGGLAPKQSHALCCSFLALRMDR
jgi:hypothetical protein